LEAIGLSQYADDFEANDIDMDLVKQVDDQMLKGHWRRKCRASAAHQKRHRQTSLDTRCQGEFKGRHHCA